MDSNYILGPNGELYHWGTKGMKWGIRRYQNKDGSLTPAGKKRYAQEEAKLKEREKSIKGHERTKVKLAKLDAKKAELDAREKALNGSETKTEKPESKDSRKNPKDMSDTELQNKVNRLRNEDAYKDLSNKLGYDEPATELDAKIAEMKKQKEYLELQRDIAKLTPEKTSKGKQFLNKVINDVIEPALLTSGKKVLTSYLEKVGLSAVDEVMGKKAKKAAEKVAADAKKAAEKVEKQEAKDRAKQEAKAAKEQAKRAAKEASRRAKAAEAEKKVFEGVIEGIGKSVGSKNTSSSTRSYKPTVDAEYWSVVSDTPVTSLATTGRSYSSGRSYVSGYLNTPIYSLPAPKDDD